MAMSCDADASAMPSASAPTTQIASGCEPTPASSRPEHGQRELRDGHPAAPAAPERRHVAVHQRRPHHLERPRRLRQREEPDDADVDADVAHPVGNRVPDEPERQARGERQQGHGRRAPRAHGGREALEGAGLLRLCHACGVLGQASGSRAARRAGLGERYHAAWYTPASARPWPAPASNALRLGKLFEILGAFRMLLLKNADIYCTRAPRPRRHPRRRRAHRAIDQGIRIDAGTASAWTRRACWRCPGSSTAHVHITGGGGEGGFATRTPELLLSDAIRGGVTTVVGCLGTDGVTRSAGRPAREGERRWTRKGITHLHLDRALRRAGADAHRQHRARPAAHRQGDRRGRDGASRTTGRRSPPSTSSRGSRPRRGAAASCRARPAWSTCTWATAGAASSLLRRIVDETEIPITQFVPTHINRNPVAVRGGHRVGEGRRVRGLHHVHRAGVPRRGRGQVQRGPAADAGRRRATWPASRSRPTGRAACRLSTRTGVLRRLDDRPRDEPVRRGARRGARRGRAARDRAARSSRRTPRAS